MKKSIIFFLICSLFFTFSCNSNKNVSNSEASNPQELKQGEIIIEGLIEIATNENNETIYSVIVNPDSKSRKTYIIENIDNDSSLIFIEKNGEFVKIRIKIIEEKSPWFFIAEFISFE